MGLDKKFSQLMDCHLPTNLRQWQQIKNMHPQIWIIANTISGVTYGKKLM